MVSVPAADTRLKILTETSLEPVVVEIPVIIPFRYESFRDIEVQEEESTLPTRDCVTPYPT